VGVSNFEQPARQLGLWEANLEPDHRLQTTLDTIRERFGSQAVRRGSQLKPKNS
jgi:hypothetical protein